MKPFGYHIPWQQIDPYALLVAMVDDAFMRLYAHVRRNARRIARICITLLPLAMLLVSSCKTVTGYDATRQTLGAALFPGKHAEKPAAGYVAVAQDYIAARPEALVALTGREVGYLFGRPSLERKDADARVWQYKAKSCIVDIYFYGNEAESGVSYVDVRLKDAPVTRDSALPARMREKCIGRVIDAAGFSGRSI